MSPPPPATPADVAAAFADASAALAAGRLEEARDAFARIVSADPGHCGAVHRLGVLHLLRGTPAEALACLQRAVGLAGADADLHNDLGCALLLLNRLPEASAAFHRALALRPRFFEARKNLGDLAALQGDQVSAVSAYLDALSLRPDFLPARGALGQVLFNRRDYGAALAVFGEVLQVCPDDAGALSHVAFCLIELRRHGEAAGPAARALALAPGLPEPHIVHGCLQQHAGRLDVAIAAYRRALALAPHHLAASNYLGAGLIASNRLAEALGVYREACARHPAANELRFNLSFAELALGDFVAGWENYEHRDLLGHGRAQRPATGTLWQGVEPLAGRTLLLHCEQGLGDTLQFARYAKLAAAAGAQVFLTVQAPLRTLFAGWPPVAGVYGPGETTPPADFHCPLLSAPRAFGTRLDTIPADVPYLSAPADHLAAWRSKLGSGVKIGLVWAGSPSHSHDRHRSIPLATFAAITRDAPHRFFSLQKEPRPGDAAELATLPGVEDLSDRLVDFTATAAAVSCLDLVITVDSAVAHLAGALGARVWLLVAFAADWRWLVDRTDSPWYPTLRIFRQPAPGDWSTVIADVRRALADFNPTRSAP